ncbi:geranylgeranyl reductase family protein [Gordonia rhizosphera]|uniref:Putative oxidoreductase n=1 Tax=Gordonia rhizosphera NBRC 16068 TaxID=1108045 RepID=K6W5Y8_9ACTN|nr:geranylgeranyl reductase family protein [Gordonia rhizosphera]GAB89116.1 putative oxidoreductase [Gordonia rhizosphera NBRC 16068]
MTSERPQRADVLVVGAGPGGSAAAAYAAAAGHDVVLLDAATFPRDKTCGDGLTPRAVAELDRLGLGRYLQNRPRIVGLALHGWGAQQRVHWPSGRFPSYGSAVARTELDDAIRDFAVARGARMVEGAKAVDVTMDGGRIAEVIVQTDQGRTAIAARDVIVADGVRSALGKALGRQWHRDTAYGVAARAYVPSGRADDEWMGSHLELRGPDDALLPGYGWVFPLGGPDGEGLLNVGVGALATAKRPAHMALRPILEHYARMVGDEWAIDGPPQRLTSALLPMGGAVSGVAGPNWMLIGDAAACVNPLNGEGIDYALETGRLAVELLDDTRRCPDHTTRWRDLLVEHYGLAFSAARRLAGVLTVPQAVPTLGRPGIRSARLMSLVVRVMGNLITPDDADLVARAWRTAGRLSTRIDDRPPFQ